MTIFVDQQTITPSDAASDPLFEEQVRIEEQARGMSLARHRQEITRSRSQGRESTTPYGSSLVARVVEPVSAALAAWIAEAETGKPGRRNSAAKILGQVAPDVAAYLAARAIINVITAESSLTRTAESIGRAIEDEVRFGKFQAKAPGLVARINKDMPTADPRVRRATLVRAFNKYVERWQPWLPSDCTHAGLKMVELVEEQTGLIQIDTETEPTTPQRKKPQTTKIIRPTPALAEWIERMQDKGADLAPTLLPMVIQPAAWGGDLFGGGYVTEFTPPQAFVRSRSKVYKQAFRRAAKEGQLDEVFASVNAIQSVRWQVNSGVLEAAGRIWETGMAIAKLPPRERLPIPPSPISRERDTATLNEEERVIFKAWKKKAHDIYAENVRRISRRSQAAQTLAVARTFSDYPAIWFPHSLDFRGRAYAMSGHLNPQGSDLAKGLLRFAEGKPLGGPVAVGWLAVHGANCFGYDKVSLEDRVSWVEERSDLIRATGEDPCADYWWAKADKPWQFLAFCIEWAGYCRDGFDFVSHLPVALDGSCSGLQHFSAALRDPVGGAAVNLTPAEKPADVYQEVADLVVEHLRQDQIVSDEHSEMASLCLQFGIDRKTTKRSTMTVPYGSTHYSAVRFTLEWIEEVTAKRKEADPFYVSPLAGVEKAAAVYLAGHVWASIGQTVVAAREAMAFLRECARVLSAKKLPIWWATPDGLPVLQAYTDQSKRRVKTKFGDGLVYLTVSDEKVDTLDARRQANGIAPNWVHSLDGSHLRRAVLMALDNGVESVAVVHDSFGTHAADTAVLGACLREAFIDLYEEADWLAEFRRLAADALGGDEDLPPLPSQGSLDLAGVRDSDFIFA